MNIVTSATNTIFGGDCGICQHAQIEHSPAEGVDCLECVNATGVGDAKTAKHALHAYASTPLEVTA